MRTALISLLLFLSGCGFHLRGHNLGEKPFPFNSLHLQQDNPSAFMAELQKNLELYKINLARSSTTADLSFQVVSELRDKIIMALSGTGQVLEYQLRYSVSIRAYDKQMKDWLPAEEISLQRTLTYDPAQVLAKEMEEQMLYRDMVSDAVQQALRRLSRAKPQPGLNQPVANDKK